MVTVPAATPDTRPPEVTVAIEVLPLLQAPPPVALLNEVVAFSQTDIVPVIVPALEVVFTVTVANAEEDPQLLVTV
jgi:hypothetical protein